MNLLFSTNTYESLKVELESGMSKLVLLILNLRKTFAALAAADETVAVAVNNVLSDMVGASGAGVAILPDMEARC